MSDLINNIVVPKKPAIIHPSQVDQASPMLRDFFQGDDSLYNKLDDNFDVKVIKKAVDFLVKNPKLSQKEVVEILANPWKFSYVAKPPTISEFMTPKYLGDTGENVFDYWRPIMADYWEFGNNYRHMVLSLFIGAGKSFVATVSAMYQNYIYFLKRNPKKEFGLSPASLICTVAFSFTQDKARELLVEPMINILETSPMYEKSRTVEQMRKSQKEYGASKVCWTTAGKTMDLSFPTWDGKDGLGIKNVSDPSKFLGLSILGGTLSELTFFLERGYSDEYIQKSYATLKHRIFSRFGFNWLARTTMDSSPNTMECSIDRWIHTGDAAKEVADGHHRNKVVLGSFWEFKTWEIDNPDSTFTIFKGDASTEAKILEDFELDKYEEIDLIHPPVELRHLFEDDLIRNLKDYAGIPAGADSKFITNRSCINECFFPGIRSIVTSILADSMQEPEHLIWNQIVDKYFIKTNGMYQFWRNPYEQRFISVDQAVKTDALGFSVIHKELDLQGREIYVVDIMFPVLSNGAKINLDAIREIIVDLKELGNLEIAGVTFDNYESQGTRQWLERKGFTVNRLSVDVSMAPYLFLLNLLSTHRLKSGRNIYFKNNLRSLITVSTKKGLKVDHTQGKTNALKTKEDPDWNKSEAGTHMKDVSDSLAAAVYQCHTNMKVTPKYVYNEEEISILDTTVDLSTRKERLLRKISKDKNLVLA